MTMTHEDSDTLELETTYSLLPREQHPDRPPLLSVEVVLNKKSFFSLREEWNSLVESSTAGIYQTFDWQWSWWRHFGDSFQLHVVVVRRGEHVIGIAPFYLEVGPTRGGQKP